MQEERKRILEMVKNGEISIDEAEKLLTELETIEKEKNEKEQTIANELSEQVDFQSEDNQEEKKNDTGKNKSESTKDMFINLVESALNKLKELDLDFHHSVDVTHTMQQNFSEFDTVLVDIPNGSVEIEGWDHGDVRVECDAKVYRTEDHDEGKEKLVKNLDFQVKNGQLTFATDEKFMKLNAKIYVPQKEYEKTKVKLFNGSIKAEQLNSKELDLKTANGKINIFNSEGNKAEIETGNGAITAEQCNFNVLEAESISGKVTVDGTFDRVDVQTIGGSIYSTVRNGNADTIRTETATGGIYIKVPQDAQIIGELKSNLGTVQVHLDDVQMKEEKNEIIQKLLKFEKAGSSDKKMFVFAESKTGSARVQPL